MLTRHPSSLSLSHPRRSPPPRARTASLTPPSRLSLPSSSSLFLPSRRPPSTERTNRILRRASSSSSSTVARASLAPPLANAPRLPPRAPSRSHRALSHRARRRRSSFVAVVDASTECGRRPTFPTDHGEIRRGGRDGESRPVDETTRPTRRRADPAASSRCGAARVTQFTDHDSTRIVYRIEHTTRPSDANRCVRVVPAVRVDACEWENARMMRMRDASVARANGRHRRRGSVAFGSVRFGSTSVRFDVGSVPNRSRRRIRSRRIAIGDRTTPRDDRLASRRRTARARVDANERGERRER